MSFGKLWSGAFVAVLVVAGPITGCGKIADTDQIEVARVDGKSITRADLFKVIRNMDDEQRPVIRNRGDLLRVLNQHIDASITKPLGKQLAKEGKINVPREMARERYFSTLGDREEQMRSMWGMEVPPPGVVTPLMKVYELTPEHLRSQKDFIEQETDLVVETMQAEQAVQYLAVEAVKDKSLTLDDAALEQEYNLNPDAFQRLERMVFRAIRIPASVPNAIQLATDARHRIDAGEDFEVLVDQYLQMNRAFVIESEIENNPTLERFQSFWLEASGAEPGTIIGPLYLPAYQQMAQNAQGQAAQREMPDSYMVLKVLEHEAARPLTLQEAKPLLAGPVIVGEMMKRLRAEHGVEVFEANLPDPQRFMDPNVDPLMQ
jgi:arsenate reductase-like glutaredoxin family protein/predicted small lipoprotein YifL